MLCEHLIRIQEQQYLATCKSTERHRVGVSQTLFQLRDPLRYRNVSNISEETKDDCASRRGVAGREAKVESQLDIKSKRSGQGTRPNAQ